MTQSSHEPRRQAIKTPMAVPAKKLSVIEMISRTRVHGRDERMRLPTEAFSDHEWPRSPCKRWLQYARYWSHRLVWTLNPSCALMASMHWLLQFPDCDARAPAPATWLPGNTRGKRKLIV